jgi:atypical dual specificity phosphatase
MLLFDVDFSFVDNQRLRLVVDDYYRQALSAYDRELYAATIVLCGGVLEGVLTWALENRKQQSPDSFKSDAKPLAEWGLAKLIDQAVKLGILGPSASRAAWAVKDFRNYIHPFNMLEGSSRADAALATNVLTAVVEITRSLRGRLSPAPRQESKYLETPKPVELPKQTSLSMTAMNFCWLETDKIAGCRGPRSVEELNLLASWGIKAIVRLADTEESWVTRSEVEAAGLTDCHEPVADFTAPKPDQVDRVLAFIDKSLSEGRAVAVSCGAGYGRTATILSCYLVGQSQSSAEAIYNVKFTCSRRPETDGQTYAVHMCDDRLKQQSARNQTLNLGARVRRLFRLR